ncbi:DUF4406 domain-containing protein [Pseudomonas silesiensis]
MPTENKPALKRQRAKQANQAIRFIADHGRRFFYSQTVNRYAYKEVDRRGKDCMRRNIAAQMYCYTVATLPGWEHSKGARLEVLIAEPLGMTVVNANDLVSMEIAG